MPQETIRLTMAQALVRYLCNQFIEAEKDRGAEKDRVPLFAGVFGIFGHGNVTCLGEALEAVQDQLPTWRGQNEQSMALAALAFTKAKKRRQIMIATSSIGPGATNMVTAAGVGHANRLPILFLSGDVFANRRPDPVLQQVEHFGCPSTTVNDCFRPVCRYWDRITHPEQILSSLPQAVATLLDPGDCGPAFLGLCQDTQELAYDYPLEFFAPRLHSIARPRPDYSQLERAAELLKTAQRPLLIAGGGVRYSLAQEAVAHFAKRRGLPLSETIAGKGGVIHDHPAHIGPLGVIGSTSANRAAEQADIVLAIGTRLQDFTTGSWTNFAPDARLISLNTARFDAVKHQALMVVGDALEAINELDTLMGDWRAPLAWTKSSRDEFASWNRFLDERQRPTNVRHPSYAQVVGAINRQADATDLVLSAAGGLPAELTKNWRVKSSGTFDCEFGFSCMGYEIAGGWGAAMADPQRDVIVMVGDGSYLMANSDIYSSVLTGHKMIVIVCDNGGFAVINRLQNFKGSQSFNNLIADCRVENAFAVDFVQHAQAMGAYARRVASISELESSFLWAKKQDRTTVLLIETDVHSWTEGDAAWDVGVPEVSARAEVRRARADHEEIRARQRLGI